MSSPNVREFRFDFSMQGDREVNHFDTPPAANSAHRCVFYSYDEICAIKSVNEDTYYAGASFAERDGLKSISYENATARTRDIETGVYEGGHKLWEGSFDLMKYIRENSHLVAGKDIFECGCGNGLPGILCLLQGAATVQFQDYNVDVLTERTLRNVYENTKNNDSIVNGLHSSVSFVAGDWQDIAENNSRTFDVIIGSEILYNAERYASLHDLFSKLLKRSGKVIIASKAVYFGMSTDASVYKFKEFLDSRGVFSIEESGIIDDGMSNIRGIYTLTFRKSLG